MVPSRSRVKFGGHWQPLERREEVQIRRRGSGGITDVGED